MSACADGFTQDLGVGIVRKFAMVSRRPTKLEIMADAHNKDMVGFDRTGRVRG